MSSPSTINRLSQTFNYYVHDFWNDIADPRAKQFPFFNSGPWLVLSIIGFYLIIIKYIGPNLMRDRKPFELRRVLIVYNAIIAIFSFYLFCLASSILKFKPDIWGCRPDPTDFSPKIFRFLNLSWLFFVSKLVELLDTIFFVLRKKNSQISALHVIHHSSVPISVWIGFKVYPSGTNVLFAYLNSTVHIFMYSYYGLAALVSGSNGSAYPRISKFLGKTKKWITIFQISQFILVIVQGLAFFTLSGCPLLIVDLIVSLGNSFLFIGLFYSFYKKSYTRKTD